VKAARSITLEPVWVRVLEPHTLLGTDNDFHTWFLTSSMPMVKADNIGRPNDRILVAEWIQLGCKNPWCTARLIVHAPSLDAALEAALGEP
jgi:hypothetical protein